MTTITGTTEPEQTQNKEMTQDDFFSQLSAAMAAGDDAKVNELMASSRPTEETQGEQSAQATADPEVVEKKDDSSVVEDPIAPKEPDQPAPQPVDVEALLRELHNVKSRVGRVDSVQSELAKLRKLVEEQAAIIAAQPKPPSKVDERLNSLKEIDPDMAETLLAMREELSKNADQVVSKESQPYDDGESELERVRRVHPDVDLILVGGAVRPVWEQWKDSLTPEQRAYAESARAEEFALAYSAFKADMAAANKPQPLKKDEGDPSTKAVEEERKRKLTGTSGPKNPPIKTISEDVIVDPEEMVRKYMLEIQKRDNLIR